MLHFCILRKTLVFRFLKVKGFSSLCEGRQNCFVRKTPIRRLLAPQPGISLWRVNAMEKYEMMEMEIIVFDREDIVTASPSLCSLDGCTNKAIETPEVGA